jgi:hypothetical protein
MQAFARAIIDAIRALSHARADLRTMTWEARGERIESLLDGVMMKAAA